MDLKNLWGDFEDLNVNTPNEILEQQAKLLPKLTGDIIFAEINALDHNPFGYDDFDINEDKFKYQFVLKSKFIDKYSFEVFKYSHDIIIYPTKVKLDFDTREELGYTELFQVVKSEGEFIDLISKVLKSNKVKNVVGAMLKLSK